MISRISETIKYYCENEMKDFKDSSFYKRIEELVNLKELKLDCSYGNSVNKKDKNFYLGISILDKNNNVIEIYDEGHLGISTILVLIDKKDRFKFFPWTDDEFIEDLNWIIENLNNIN